MIRRLLTVLSVPAVVAASLSGVTPSATASSAPNAFKVKAPVAFSPDGDGVKDRVPVRVKLPSEATVVVEVTSYYSKKVVRTARLGTQPTGVTTWTWDGRADGGKRLPAGPYVVEARADWTDPGVSTAPRKDVVFIDRSFSPRLSAPTYGVAAKRATYRVFPRTRVVRDALELDARVDEDAVTSLRLVIRNDRGRIVRNDDVNREIADSRLGSVPAAGGGLRELKAHGRTVRWSGRRGAKPLPPGRYTAVVTGKDRAGNRGTSDRLRIFVSRDKLVWKEKSATVGAAESRTSECSFYPDEYRCGDLPDCGSVLPSTLFPGGLSYRSRPSGEGCREAIASSLHLLEVPEAAGVRGLAAARVAVDGAPTTAGESDAGTLTVYGPYADLDVTRSEVVGVAARSDWVTNPLWGEGLMPERGGYRVLQRDPAALWTYATTGDDSVDVAAFTVDVRYLAVKR